MGPGKKALLTDRGIVRVGGVDAAKFLQGLITNDMQRLVTAPAMFAALLSPQGKVLFDFFVVRAGDAYLLETARDRAADLVKRLTFYKLRADVVIEDVSSAWAVAALWDGAHTVAGSDRAVLAFPDSRHPDLGVRLLHPDPGWAPPAGGSSAAEYHAHRIALGVPEGGKDYTFGETFPHEALLDALNGIAFDKGCYVGQEVVARMQHRGSARRRIVPVKSACDLPPPGTEIRAGTVAIGALGSTAGAVGLATVRLDRAAEAHAKGEALTAAGIEISLVRPAWAPFDVPGARS